VRNGISWILGLAMAGFAAAASHGAPAGKPALEPINPASFFTMPEEEVRLAWKVSGEAKPVEEKYRVTNYSGQEVAHGPAPEQEGEVAVTLKLPRGYYDVEVRGQTFGLVVLEPHEGKADDFFGMDAVLTWLDRRPAMREAMVAAMKRSGVAMARERIHWNSIEPAAGQWDWEARDQTLSLRETYARAGLPVLEMFHSPGPARGAFPFRSNYPQDLALLAASWPEIHRKFQSSWGGLEVWNEPEGPAYGNRLPADQYVMVVKAMRHAWVTNHIDTPLGGGVFMGGYPGPFHQFCALNGMLDDVDFVSIHDYKPATKMERLVGLYRDWLRANGREGMPLWITESGWAWPKGGGRPARDDDRMSALEIAMKGVEARACGVTRYMPFCLPFYEENGVKSFSMMGKEVTPLRSIGAYAQSIRVLSGRHYVGDLKTSHPAILRARVFEDDAGGRVAVLYTDMLDDRQTVTLPGKVLKAEGADGRALPLDTQGAFALPDGIAYAWIENAPLETETGALALAQAARQPAPRTATGGAVILQYLPDPAHVSYSSSRYIISPEDASHLPIRVRIFNLSAEPQTLSLRLALPGTTPEESALRTVEVPAQGTTEALWTVDVSGKWTTPEPQPLLITGARADGTPVSPLAIPLLVEDNLGAYLPAYARQAPLPVDHLKNWTPNHSPAASARMITEDGAWKLEVKFGAGDRWIYPKLNLPPGTLAEADGFLLRARAKEAADVRMGLYDSDGATYLTIDPVIPADGKWHVIFVPLASFEANQEAGHKGNGEWRPGDILAVSAGMNDRSENRENTLEISDLLVVGGRNSPQKNAP